MTCEQVEGIIDVPLSECRQSHTMIFRVTHPIETLTLAPSLPMALPEEPSMLSRKMILSTVKNSFSQALLHHFLLQFRRISCHDKASSLARDWSIGSFVDQWFFTIPCAGLFRPEMCWSWFDLHVCRNAGTFVLCRFYVWAIVWMRTSHVVDRMPCRQRILFNLVPFSRHTQNVARYTRTTRTIENITLHWEQFMVSHESIHSKYGMMKMRTEATCKVSRKFIKVLKAVANQRLRRKTSLYLSLTFGFATLDWMRLQKRVIVLFDTMAIFDAVYMHMLTFSFVCIYSFLSGSTS